MTEMNLCLPLESEVIDKSLCASFYCILLCHVGLTFFGRPFFILFSIWKIEKEWTWERQDSGGRLGGGMGGKAAGSMY